MKTIMNTSSPALQPTMPHSWTLADFASTYRFWALLTAIFAFTFATRNFIQAINWLPAPALDRSYVYEMTLVANIPSILLGVLLASRNDVSGLLGAALCSTALYVSAWVFQAPILLFATAFVMQTVAMAFIFGFPVLLFSAASDRLAFTSVFAIFMLGYILLSIFNSIFFSLYDLGSGNGFIVGIGALIVVICLLLSLRKNFFNSAPIPRQLSFPPASKSPAQFVILTGLPYLFLGVPITLITLEPVFLYPVLLGLPIVAIVLGIPALIGLIASAYWIYRIHGETAHFYPSPQLFTPKAALWMYLLVPISIPWLMLNLGAVLRQAAATHHVPLQRSENWFTAWSILFPPFAIGLAQRMMNDILAHRAE